MQDATGVLGPGPARKTPFSVGKGNFIMVYHVDLGNTMNGLAIDSSFECWQGRWVQRSQQRNLAKAFANWSPIVQKLVKLMDRSETSAWSM